MVGQLASGQRRAGRCCFLVGSLALNYRRLFSYLLTDLSLSRPFFLDRISVVTVHQGGPVTYQGL